MKTNSSPTRDAQGSVLVITLSVVAVAAIVLASYLLIVQAQTSSVARSQSWNTLISVSEAGAEEGMSLINKGAPAILPSGLLWTNGAASDGWTVSGGIYTMTRTLYNNNSYTVTVDITGSLSPYPVITCTATVPYNSIPWVFSSAGGPFLATGGVITGNGAPSNSTVTVGRKVQVQTVPSPLFNAAVVTKLNFDLNGNGTTVDSFDSSTSVYSTGGLYDSTKRKSNGTIATDSSIVGDISIGQGNIYGHVYTGPNTAQTAVQVGNNGAVGDAAWQASGGTGIEPGYWKGDFNMNIPDVPTPTFSGGALPAAVGGVINVNGGNYTVTSVGSPLNITGPTTLWVQGSFGQGVTIATTNNASLVLFVGRASGTGDSVAMGGNGSMNYPGVAANFQLYGLPSLTSITLSGNAAFVAAIYAPEAALTGNGGGNNNFDTSGAVVVNSVTLNGHWNFHYDEHLAMVGPTFGWVPHQWAEQKYP